MASPVLHPGTKRPHSGSIPHIQVPLKKRRVYHTLPNVQIPPTGIELASQDPIYAQGQLLKSISAALVIAGYDGVKATALEMFRSHVEEYMLRFLSHARISMRDGRRTTPTPLDFASALAQMPNSSTASSLQPHLSLQIPDKIAFPVMARPEPAPPTPIPLDALLEPLLDKKPPSYVPDHFPARPPTHAWQHTDVFPQREKDSKKMREQATQEGTLAEQALRKLAVAAKTSAPYAEKRRNGVLSGEGKVRGPLKLQRSGFREQEDTFADALKEIEGDHEFKDIGSGKADGREFGVDVSVPDGIAVNHDMSHWRKGTAKRLV